MDNETLKQYKNWGATPPSHDPHGGTIDEVLARAEQLLPNEWWLEGNVLKGKTRVGTLAQRIPTNYILKGTEDGLPVFEKIQD